MKINKQLFNFVLNRPSLLSVLLKVSNFEKFPLIQNQRNKLLARAIEGIYSAGETLESAEDRINELEKKKVGVILNYAMEAAGKEGIKLMETEYHKIMDCLKNHDLSCVALKPTALIPEEQIFYLTDLMRGKLYDGNIDIDKLLDNPEIKKIAEPFCKLSEKAVEIGSRILIDAEQSNLQPGVDLLALYLMDKFNQNSKAYIYNTYQLYLKDSPLRIREHKLWIESKQSHFAAKLVRGAYMTYENSSKNQSHKNYVICSSKSEVDENYNNALKNLLLDGRSSLVVATHNLESLNILKAILKETKQYNQIEYAFLMGFGDKISKQANGIRCLEYVPYGPSEVKIPYLIRRLEENISIFQNK